MIYDPKVEPELAAREHQQNMEALRARTMNNRILLVAHTLLDLSQKCNAITSCPDRISGTARRAMHLRFIEDNVASIAEYLKYFLDDIAKTP